MKTLRIAIPIYGAPTNARSYVGFIEKHCEQSIENLLGCYWLKDTKVKFRLICGESDIDIAREKCIYDPQDYEYLLFIDDDIGFKTDTVKKMFELLTENDGVICHYPKKNNDEICTFGLGLSLFKAECFRGLNRPYMRRYYGDGEIHGEDFSLIHRLREARYSIIELADEQIIHKRGANMAQQRQINLDETIDMLADASIQAMQSVSILRKAIKSLTVRIKELESQQSEKKEEKTFIPDVS